MYAWLQDRTPDYENLRRLARDLDAPVAWLVSGENGGGPATARVPARSKRPAATSATNVNAAFSSGVVDVHRLRSMADAMAALHADLDAALAAFPDPCFWLAEDGRVLAVRGPRDPNIAALSPGGALGDT